MDKIVDEKSPLPSIENPSTTGVPHSGRAVLSPFKSQRLWDILALILLVCIGWFYWHGVDNQQMGFTHDDGVYALTAKALASGKGFTLWHVVGQPAEIKYPFIYPVILSLVWLVQPAFPDNLPLMNAITLAFGLAACGLIYLYLTRSQRFPGWVGLIILALVTSNFFFMYFLTSVMSEAPYLFFSLMTLWYVHRQSLKHPTQWPISGVLIAVILSALTFQTRVLGITLMGAIGLWLLLQRQWRNAFLYGLGSLLLGVLPWVLWVKFQTPPLNDLTYPLVNAYSNYGLEFVHNYTGMGYLRALRTDFFSLLNRLLEDMIPLIPNFIKLYPALKKSASALLWRDAVTLVSMYALFGYFILQIISASRKLTEKGRWNLDVISIPALYLAFYVIAITLWNYEDQFTRFLIVVTPLLWMYFFKPFLVPLASLGQAGSTLKQKIKAASALLAILCVTVAGLWTLPSSYHIISTARNEHWVESGKAKWLWGEYLDSFAWIRQNLPRDASLAVASDAVYGLYTERATFYVFYASLKRVRGKFTQDAIPLLMKSLDHHGVRYLVAEPHMQFRTIQHPINFVAKDLMERFPERFQLLYATPREAIRVYRIKPPALNNAADTINTK